MPDIFDEIGETETKPAGDVFDELLPELPEPKPWELSPTGQKPYLGQFSGGPGSPYEELNREEAMNIFKSLAEPPVAAPRFEGESTLGKVAAGVGNVAGGIYNMLASPVGLATLPFAATKIGAPIAKGVFGGLAAKTAGEQLGEASVTGDVQQYTEGLLNAIMAPGIALPGRFGYVEPENVRMAKDLAREIERTEPTFEPKTPEAMRQLGIRVPDFSPFADPEVARLADAALQERMRMVQIPGQEQNALMDLRRAIEPPRLEIPQPVARAERIEGGGQAPYGKVSFMREAEAPLPERTQAEFQRSTKSERDILQKFVDEEVAKGAVFQEGLPEGIKYRKPSRAPTQEEYQRRIERENVEQGLTTESGYYLDEPRTQTLPEPEPLPEIPSQATTIIGISGRPKPLVKPTVLSALQRSRLRVALARGATEETILNILRLGERQSAQPQRRKLPAQIQDQPIEEPAPKPAEPAPATETAKPTLTPEQEALQRELAGEMEQPAAPPPEPSKVAEVKPESVTEGEVGGAVEITPELGDALRDTFSDKNKHTANLPLDTAQEYSFRGVVNHKGRTLYAYVRKGVNRGPRYQFNRPETIELYESEQRFGVPLERNDAVAVVDAGTVLTPRIYEAQSALAGEPKQVSRSPVAKDTFTSAPAEPPPPAVSPTEGKGKQAWEMTAEEAAQVTGLTWDRWQDSISAATKEGKITEDSVSYKSAAKTGNRDFAKLKNEAQKQQPPQPSAGIEKQKAGEGKAVSESQVSAAASRFRPREQILFETPLKGPSGAKLTAYEWKWQPEEFVDKYGEEKTRRVSNWEEAESSADTGRDIVHQFLVELPNGEKRLVSAESVPVLLGFTERGKSSKFPSLVSAAKTLAKLRMKLSATKSQNAEYAKAVEASNQLPLPEITSEPAIASVGRDKGKRWGTVWKMGDSHVIQHDELPINAERRDALISTWRSDRVREMGAKPSYASERDIQNRIDRQQRKLNEITGSQSSIQSITPGPGAQTVGETPTKGIITGRAIEKWADDTLRGGATHLGPDVLAAYLVKGAALIERGIINFAEWSARMIAEHGDKVKPHLRELFTAAQETARRAPIAETGTLKSAREIVEQRIAQSQGRPSVTATTPPASAPTPATAPTPTTSLVPAAAQTATPTTPTAQAGARPKAQVTLDDIYRIFEPASKKPTPLKAKGVNLIESIRTGFSSKFRPINQLAEDIAKAYGGARKDIAGIFEQLKGSSGKGEADIYRFNRDVSSLVKGQEKDFNAYMFLNRSLDRLRQDLKDIQTAMAGGNVPRLNRRSVAQYTIPQLEAKLAMLEQKLGLERLATFQKAASEYQRYMDDALKLQVESGRMSQDVYDAIKSGNQFYAPFKVMKYLEESMKPEGTGRKIDTVADYTKAMEGIEDPDFRLGDMLGAARQSLLISRILADKAIAMQNIADLSKIDTQRLFIKRLNKGEDIPLGMQAVNVFENGSKVRYATRPEVAQALDIYGDTGGGVISGILRGFSVPFKLGATALNVPFQISNLMADVPRQALVSKYGIRGVNDLVRYPLDLVHAIYSSMTGDILRRDNKLFLDFLDSGAAATTVQEHLTPKALQYRDPSTMSKSKRIALNILYSPAEFSTAIEQVSKILGVKRAMRFEGVKSGAELAKQVPEAITEIRRFSGSPDFGRQGKFVEQARLNLLYMFLNARIQGAVADLGRLMGRDGAKRAAITWFRIGSAVGLPTAYLYALNNSPEFKSDYDQRPQQEKDNYWLIPKDSFITNEQGERIRDYWRIPKRESSKWIANMTESALNFAEKRDAKTFANFSQKMIEDISPVNIQGDTAQERLESVGASLNPVIKAPLELATGRDMYRHRDLLGETLRRASPEQQYTDRTATAFKVLADKIPDIAPDVLRSPVMLENITRNMTAGLLTQFLSKKPMEGRGKIENAALLQRFQAVPYTDNAEFTKQMKELERESADDYLRRHRSAQKLIEDNKGKTLSELIGKSSQDPKVMKQVVDLWMAKENGATSQDRRLIALPAKQRAQYISRMLKPMSPAEKERAILDLAKKRVLTETVFQEMSQLPQ